MDTTDELTALRADVAALKNQVSILCDHLGLDPEKPSYSPPYLSLDAEMISIRSGKMEIPIVLEASKGEGSIHLRDKKQVARASLEVGETGAFLVLRNADGKVIVTIGESSDGSGAVFVHDNEGNRRAGLKANGSIGAVAALNGAGTAQAVMAAREDGGEVMLVDADGRVRVKVHSCAESGNIMVNETSGRPVAYMSSHDDKGLVCVLNETGDQVGAFSSDGWGGVVILYDNDGVVRTSLPPVSG